MNLKEVFNTVAKHLAALAELERERDELRARLAEYEQAPTVAWLATQQHPRNPSQCVVTTKLDGWDHAELIARPTRKDGENASLIATTPELVEALRMVVAADTAEDWSRAVDYARKALALPPEN